MICFSSEASSSFGSAFDGYHRAVDCFEQMDQVCIVSPMAIFIRDVLFWANGEGDCINFPIFDYVVSCSTSSLWIYFTRPRKGEVGIYFNFLCITADL